MEQTNMDFWGCLILLTTFMPGIIVGTPSAPSWPPNYAYSVDVKSLNDVLMSMTVQVTPKRKLTIYHDGTYLRGANSDYFNKFWTYQNSSTNVMEWGVHRHSGGKIRDLCWEEPVNIIVDDFNEPFPQLPDLSRYQFVAEEEYHGVAMDKWSITNTNVFGETRERMIWVKMEGGSNSPVPVHMQDRFMTQNRYVYGYTFHDFYGFREIKLIKGDSERIPRVKNCSKLTERNSAIFFPNVNLEQPKVAGRFVRHLPESFDWRLRGAVSPVRYSRKCGDWAFAVAGSMEGAYVVQRKKPLPVFSEQYLIDCSWKTGNQGCSSGEAQNAFNWIKMAGGIPTTYNYGPFNDIDGVCKMKKDLLYAPIKNIVKAPTDEKDFKAALIQYGPIVIKLVLSPKQFLAFKRYQNGVFNPLNDTTDGSKSHVYALVVGYGDLDGSPYWLVKGSFGNWWGLQGYMLLSTDFDREYLFHHSYYPVLKKPEVLTRLSKPVVNVLDK